MSFLFVLCSVHFFNNLANLRSEPKRKRKQNKQNLDNTLTISPKTPPLSFSALCDFFWNFLDCTKGSPFICFDILKHNGCQKIPKGPPFYIFRHCDTIQKSHFKIFLGNIFQSLKGPPFNFFHILQPAGVLQSPKGPPFYIFRHCDTVQIIFFHILPPAGVSQNPKSPPFTILSLRYSAVFGRSRLVLITVEGCQLAELEAG